VTRPARTIADLLASHVEPGVVGRIAAEVLDGGLEGASDVADRVAPYAARFGLPPGDGRATLEYLLALAGPGSEIGTAGSVR
jgi:hypothetical protein